jgi:tRNA threonylcarbamoyl adenosine modification protein YjeE
MTEDSQPFAHSVALPDMAATQALGTRIAAGLEAGDAVALEGDLGAGKTTLARAILRAAGVTEDVPSPTFTLVQLYETPHLVVRHYDLYRIESPGEIDELGLDDALGEGAVLIEWPERAEGRLPAEMLHVALTATGPGWRTALVSGPAKWARCFQHQADHAR